MLIRIADGSSSSFFSSPQHCTSPQLSCMASETADLDLLSLIQSLPACKRCRECKRGCDTLLPACHQCAKAGVECIFFDHVLDEYLPRR
jgi:Fungal Zn(2)-Cys(6) binuclear cluster domain